MAQRAHQALSETLKLCQLCLRWSLAGRFPLRVTAIHLRCFSLHLCSRLGGNDGGGRS
jgi:hypothetical protein